MRIASVRTRVVSSPYVRPFVISGGTSSHLGIPAYPLRMISHTPVHVRETIAWHDG
ncbi:hypothetical protein ACFYT4_30750 [Streptomyces sp. NPDC004609]|uniref:hypothetical protein n=1 Tax=Streptomyces sp. NPDC004609 TaxID=3364704 RepID=UPI0036CFA463